MANENIIREIDEELRSDRMRNAWRRFGPLVIGGAVAIVLFVAGYEAWTWWQRSTAATSSDQFYSALELAENGDIAAAQDALNTVEADGSGGYPVLARFREAALLAEQGKSAEAVAAYDALSTNENNSHLRELALVLAAYQLVDAGDVSGVETRVGALDNPNSPMRNSAREAIGLVKYQAGDLDGAQAAIEAALADPLLDQQSRNRLQIYLAQLVAEGAGAPDAVAPPPVAPVTTDDAAPADDAVPAVSDGSAMDTAPEPAATDEADETVVPAPAEPVVVAPAEPVVEPAPEPAPEAVSADEPAPTDAESAPAAGN
ncbi:tetratricopeptide repeat protein [Devosia sp.]|uniref:tetratricopeptide repeat protein n=1 Tax=Devosia sp. TaxID=1871048 RepID=UPI003A959893